MIFMKEMAMGSNLKYPETRIVRDAGVAASMNETEPRTVHPL